ncbi:hypothetical protein APUTEX25_001746 [Auxenochlorella protothecoides]|uniref:Uncharacterized protein n=1 Tax=Auxenochlorella protothecoides TaxID=3075 RepID=A0A3M7L7S2_AUXPR|nr:hypothetical protein APUTEX25_001746 [Auxenochlorella protothecoides]|eukprot:RMZ57546.1 hypothetical protein APUTEX25_001746 [Auxenochlorella protothecoides]
MMGLWASYDRLLVRLSRQTWVRAATEWLEGHQSVASIGIAVAHTLLVVALAGPLPSCLLALTCQTMLLLFLPYNSYLAASLGTALTSRLVTVSGLQLARFLVLRMLWTPAWFVSWAVPLALFAALSLAVIPLTLLTPPAVVAVLRSGNYYEVLQLPRGAGEADVRRAKRGRRANHAPRQGRRRRGGEAAFRLGRVWDMSESAHCEGLFEADLLRDFPFNAHDNPFARLGRGSSASAKPRAGKRGGRARKKGSGK